MFVLDVKLLCEEIILHVVVLWVFNDVLFEVVFANDKLKMPQCS